MGEKIFKNRKELKSKGYTIYYLTIKEFNRLNIFNNIVKKNILNIEEVYIDEKDKIIYCVNN